MSGSSLIGLEAFFILALVLGFGAWELYTLRRDRRRDPPDAAKGVPRVGDGDGHGDTDGPAAKP